MHENISFYISVPNREEYSSTNISIDLKENFDKIDELHHIEERVIPDQERMLAYNKRMKVFNQVTDLLCDIGDVMTGAAAEKE